MTPEDLARTRIDALLESAGWVLQDFKQFNRTAALGVAVRHFPLGREEADYLLFVEGKACGVIEAKRQGVTLSGVSEQSEKYMGALPDHLAKWRETLVFDYESTGDETLFRDMRDPQPRSRRVFAFHRPDTLLSWLRDDGSFRGRLAAMPTLDATRLRDCQTEAIGGLEASLAQAHPRSLIQMATGAGKTFTACSFSWRLADIVLGRSSREWLRNELSLLSFATAFLAALKDKPTSSPITPTDIAVGFSEDSGFRRVNAVQISARSLAGPSLYEPPTWLPQEDRWRFQLGYPRAFQAPSGLHRTFLSFVRRSDRTAQSAWRPKQRWRAPPTRELHLCNPGPFREQACGLSEIRITVFGARHQQGLRFEVDILPSQAGYLRTPHAREHRHQKKVAHLVVRLQHGVEPLRQQVVRHDRLAALALSPGFGLSKNLHRVWRQVAMGDHGEIVDRT